MSPGHPYPRLLWGLWAVVVVLGFALLLMRTA